MFGPLFISPQKSPKNNPKQFHKASILFQRKIKLFKLDYGNFLILFLVVAFASRVNWTSNYIVLIIYSCLVNLLLDIARLCSLRHIATDSMNFFVCNDIRFLTYGSDVIEILSGAYSWSISRPCVHVDFLLLNVEIIHAC